MSEETLRLALEAFRRGSKTYTALLHFEFLRGFVYALRICSTLAFGQGGHMRGFRA